MVDVAPLLPQLSHKREVRSAAARAAIVPAPFDVCLEIEKGELALGYLWGKKGSRERVVKWDLEDLEHETASKV